MEIVCEVISGSGVASKVQDSNWGRDVLKDLCSLMNWKRIERGTLNVYMATGIPNMKCPQGAILHIESHSIPVVIVWHRGPILELMAEEHLRKVYSIKDGVKGIVSI